MSKYVSGPWEAQGKYIQLPDDKRYKTIAEVRYPIHDIPYPEEKFEPTIKLMAAAPELLEVAEYSLEIVESLPCECDSYNGFICNKHDWKRKLKKAIQKAKGDNNDTT